MLCSGSQPGWARNQIKVHNPAAPWKRSATPRWEASAASRSSTSCRTPRCLPQALAQDSSWVTAVTEPCPTRKRRLVLDLRVALPASPTALPEAQSTLLSTEAFATESTRCWHGRAGAVWTQRPATGCPAPGSHSRHRASAGMKRGLHGEHKGQPVMCECWKLECRAA